MNTVYLDGINSAAGFIGETVSCGESIIPYTPRIMYALYNGFRNSHFPVVERVKQAIEPLALRSFYRISVWKEKLIHRNRENRRKLVEDLQAHMLALIFDFQQIPGVNVVPFLYLGACQAGFGSSFFYGSSKGTAVKRICYFTHSLITLYHCTMPIALSIRADN